MSAQVLEMIDAQAKETNGDEVIIEQTRMPAISDEVRQKLEGMAGLVSLAFNECQLAQLANFPHLPKLVRLELLSNPLEGKEVAHLSRLKALESLTLSSSRPLTYADLKPLQKLENLIQLDFSDNALAKEPDYREKMFEMFENLVVLDNMNHDGEEVNYSEEEDDNSGAPLSGEESQEKSYSESEEEGDEEEGEGEEDEEEEEEEEEEESSVSDQKKKPAKKTKNK